MVPVRVCRAAKFGQNVVISYQYGYKIIIIIIMYYYNIIVI